tara:strand:+ start:16169 stop:16627 length:459 start_codon:yes stop_codon:yes gene_type:complete
MYQIKYNLRYQWINKRFKQKEKRYTNKWVSVYARDKKQALKVGLKWLKWSCTKSLRAYQGLEGLDWEKAENILCEPVTQNGHPSGYIEDRSYLNRNDKEVYIEDIGQTHEEREVIRAENLVINEKQFDGNDYVIIKARKDSALVKRILARDS